MEDKRVFPVVDLPDELIIAIFTHLRWRACLTLRAVSRTWLHLSEDDRYEEKTKRHSVKITANKLEIT